MIYNYDAYAMFVVGILKRVCVIRTEQLLHNVPGYIHISDGGLEYWLSDIF